ncbi:MAG: hypothetical protein ACRD1Z_16485, partial [Vicinamibacteria bacterium]
MLALGALVIAALFSPVNAVRPKVPALVLNLAPPAPAPRSGARVESPTPLAKTRVVFSDELVRPFARIPDEILAPVFELTGIDEGFLDGSPEGLPGGIPGGVVGGTPGGIVGGVVGGTGDELPRFPKPDVGPSPIQMPQPSYTRQAIRDNVTGTV